MEFENFDIMKSQGGDEEIGYLLLRHKYQKNRGTVIHFNPSAGQISCAMPSDFAPGGGTWYARPTDSGIAYIAGIYSYSYAKKIFNEYCAEDEIPEIGYVSDELIDEATKYLMGTR